MQLLVYRVTPCIIVIIIIIVIVIAIAIVIITKWLYCVE